MTLSFKTEINGVPTYFVEKIWKGFEISGFQIKEQNYEYGLDFYNIGIQKPKLYTIREDKHNRWQAGNNIHFVINNRTPKRFQFAPVIPCIETQKIQIFWDEPYNYDKGLWQTPIEIVIDSNHSLKPDLGDILIDSNSKEILQTSKEAEQLAINDGFESLKDFLLYFNKDFTGKIIHWTDFKY